MATLTASSDHYCEPINNNFSNFPDNLRDQLAGLPSLADKLRCLGQAVDSRFYRTHKQQGSTHLHLAGDWKDFCVKELQNAESIAATKFRDTFYDNFNGSLLKRDEWLRQRVTLPNKKYPKGQVEWSLKTDIKKVGKVITYQKIHGESNILKHFNASCALSDLYPFSVVAYSCIRISCFSEGNRRCYLDIACLGKEKYYFLITYCIDTKRTQEIIYPGGSGVRSKALEALYHQDLDLYMELYGKESSLNSKLETKLHPLLEKQFEDCEEGDLLPAM